MNDVNTNKRLSPTQAIIVYRDSSEYNPLYFLEKREIRNQGGKYILMAPVPLADDVLKDIAKSYVKSNSLNMDFGSLIAPHMLYGLNKPGKLVVMWYRPAMKRVLNFDTILKIKGSSTVEVPATLYVLINTNLYIYALMTNDRPELKTKLYKAPFFNIYDDGRVCLGTARVGSVREKTFELEAHRYERAFFMAEQNGGGGTQNTCKTPLAALWNGLIKKKGPFPSSKELVQHSHKTVADLISKLIGNNVEND
jgi:PRTRC genetic system protein B